MNTDPTPAFFGHNRLQMQANALSNMLQMTNARIAALQADVTDLTTNGGKNVLARSQAQLAQLEADHLAETKQIVGAAGEANLFPYLDSAVQAEVTALVGPPPAAAAATTTIPAAPAA